jgi:hypothetical protein
MTVAQERFMSTLAEFFHQRLKAIARAMKPEPQEDTVWYVGSMMARLGDSRQLFSHDENGLAVRPLALLYQDARESEKDWERCLLLRQLGDQALFLGSLFPARWERKGIYQDYFVGMGGAAYSYLSEHAQTHRPVFAELAETFSKWLEVLADVCFPDTARGHADVLKLYQQWRETGSEHLAERLRSLGVILDDGGEGGQAH